MRNLFAIFLLLAATACGKQQSPTQSIAASYNASYRDNVIKNWQSRVADTERCSSFKDRFEDAGKRHESVASGAFVMDMQKIMDEVKSAGCELKP